MMQTGFSIIQKVRHGLNLPVITSIEGTSDPDELQFLEWTNQVCEDIRQNGPMRQQVMSHTFDTVIGVNTYPLPGDFWESIPLTQYNKNTSWPLIGPLSDSDFTAFKDGTVSIPTEYVWRIKGFDENASSVDSRQIEIYPTPAAIESLGFEYVTGHLFIPPNWKPSTAYVIGNFCNANGKIYICDTNGNSGTVAPTGTALDQTDGTTQWDYYNAPYEVLVSDGDTCIFDASAVKLGIRTQYYYDRESQLAMKSEVEFKKAVDRMRYRWEAQTRARGDSRQVGRNQPYVKPGSWSI